MAFEEENIQDYLKKIPPQQMGRLGVIGLGVIVAIAFLASSFYSVAADSVGVVLRFGEYVRTTQPGLHMKMPFGIEKAIKVPVTRILSQEFGFRTGRPGVRTVRSREALLDESLMLTGDLNVVVVDWIVQYKVKDPRAFLFNVQNVEETIRDASETAMRQVVGNRSVDGVLTIERIEVAEDVAQNTQEILDAYGSGIQVVTVKLQDVTPPDPVKPAFNSVNEAKQEKEQLINEAMKEYNTAVPKASGDAERTIKEAEGYAIGRVNRAEGDASRFLSLWRQYTLAQDVTRRRIYMETMAEILPKVKRKYIVDEEEKGILRLLPLGEAAGGDQRSPKGEGGER